MTACIRCIVEGRVQGVFFRDSTRREARRLDLTGWVRNLPNGNVEVLACGEPQRLEALRSWLRAGPAQARVTKISCDTAAAHFHSFEIR